MTYRLRATGLVLISLGCADEPKGEPTTAVCAESGTPEALPASYVLHCVERGTSISARNFDAPVEYLPASSITLDPNAPWRLGWRLGRLGLEGPQEIAHGAFPPPTDEGGQARFWTIASGGQRAELVLSKAAHPATGLQCATLKLSDPPSEQTHALSCYVSNRSERALCSSYGFPGAGWIQARDFMVSFLGTPPESHVRAVMDQLAATTSGIREITQISSSGGLYAYLIRFEASVSPASARSEVLRAWCPLADDLRVDLDSPLEPRSLH